MCVRGWTLGPRVCSDLAGVGEARAPCPSRGFAVQPPWSVFLLKAHHRVPHGSVLLSRPWRPPTRRVAFHPPPLPAPTSSRCRQDPRGGVSFGFTFPSLSSCALGAQLQPRVLMSQAGAASRGRRWVAVIVHVPFGSRAPSGLGSLSSDFCQPQG